MTRPTLSVVGFAVFAFLYTAPITVAFLELGRLYLLYCLCQGQINPPENRSYPMLFFLISGLCFFLFSKVLPLQLLLSWANEMRLFSVYFWQELVCLFIEWLEDCILTGSCVFRMSPTKKSLSKAEKVEVGEEFSILDLPELALECILGRLSPAGLCNMAGVCSLLRDRCRSDHLWERHMKEKWGRVLGQAAYREWQSFIDAKKNSGVLDGSKAKGWLGSLSCMSPILWLISKTHGTVKPTSSFPSDSIMSWYLSLESGKCWFPAQVYNREHGHVGFMLSCYDAELRYDSCTDTFHARYPPHRHRTMVIEDGVQWERLRAPPIDNPAHELYISDCLNDLRPGDHIEIQWRRNKEFPYGWWYGVVGHLESCDGNGHLCRCHSSDTIMLKFNQYAPGSRWRRTAINRKDHREEGNKGDGFYGGIRKLHSEDEIAMWRRLWPTEVLE